MSSEEDNEGEDLGTLMIVSISWESTKLKKYKEQLDKTYLQGCTRNALSLQKKRKRKDFISRREQPKNAPSWAINNAQGDEYTFTE